MSLIELKQISFNNIKKKIKVDKICLLPSDKICHQSDNNQSSWKIISLHFTYKKNCLDLHAVLKIHSILMRIRILDPRWKKLIRIQVISLRFTDSFQQQSRIFKFFVLFYSLTFMLKLDRAFKFYNLSFFNSSYLDLESKTHNFASFSRYFAHWIWIRGSP